MLETILSHLLDALAVLGGLLIVVSLIPDKLKIREIEWIKPPNKKDRYVLFSIGSSLIVLSLIAAYCFTPSQKTDENKKEQISILLEKRMNQIIEEEYQMRLMRYTLEMFSDDAKIIIREDGIVNVESPEVLLRQLNNRRIPKEIKVDSVLLDEKQAIIRGFIRYDN